MKWICCQIGAREHYAVPRALNFRGAMEMLLTDAWLPQDSLLAHLSQRLKGRFHRDLAEARVVAWNWHSVAFELRSRVARSERETIVRRNQWFQDLVVSRLGKFESREPHALVAYSYAAKDILRYAKTRGWRTALAQIDPGPREESIVARLYAEDAMQRGRWAPRSQKQWVDWQEECEIADRIVVNSSWSFESLVAEGVPSSKIRIVPLAYDHRHHLQRVYPDSFTKIRPLRVLFLGQINLRKGIAPLLDAMRLLKGMPVELWLVGPVQIHVTPEQRDNVQLRWFGSVSRQAAQQYYRDADVFILPTFSDGFGLTQLEAQAARLPVITTKFCGDVIQDGHNGWVLNEVTPSAIAAALMQCLKCPTQLARLAENSADLTRFGSTRVGGEWLRVFD